jgi:hypothetical protein
MAVTRDIPRAWVRPGRVMRERLAGAGSERVAFVYLAVASVLGFAAALPGLVRQSRLPDPAFEAAIRAEASESRIMTVPADITDAKFEALMSGALMGWIFIVPILAYALAWLSHLIARALGGRGTGLEARHALFWAFLASTPALLLAGLTTGFVGEGPASALTGTLWISGFVWIWINSLHAAETPDA